MRNALTTREVKTLGRSTMGPNNDLRSFRNRRTRGGLIAFQKNSSLKGRKCIAKIMIKQTFTGTIPSLVFF
jgi:hypothetical protein